MSGWQRELAALGELRADEPLARHVTLGVGGPARWFFRPADRAALVAAMRLAPADVPILPLGRGSNLLPPDEGFPGLVLDMGELANLRVAGREIEAEAGVRMGRLARAAAEAGLAGLEFMATVPGDVGGGVAMNAGAFGQEVADTLQWAEVVLRGGETRRLDARELDMGYRRARLPDGALVMAAGFALTSDAPEAIRERMRSMRQRRGATQPLAQPNCGSVFKNPDGDYAARLIEAAGLKGLCIGGARISEVHANFIVNEGGATSADVRALIARAQAEVAARFGVRLEPEVRILEGRS